MSFSTSSSQQATVPSHLSIPGPQKLRRVATRIFQKIKISKDNKDIDLGELGETEIQVTRFVTFIRPTEAPVIIDLRAMRQSIRPQPARIYTNRSKVPRSQADLNSPELRLQRSFESPNSPTETGTPRRRNPQQAFVFEATSERPAVAALDDIADFDDKDYNYDVDWSLLDLPENIYGRLANESRHSLI